MGEGFDWIKDTNLIITPEEIESLGWVRTYEYTNSPRYDFRLADENGEPIYDIDNGCDYTLIYYYEDYEPSHSDVITPRGRVTISDTYFGPSRRITIFRDVIHTKEQLEEIMKKNDIK